MAKRKDLRRIRLDHVRRKLEATDAWSQEAYALIEESDQRIAGLLRTADEQLDHSRRQLEERSARLIRGIDEVGQPLNAKQRLAEERILRSARQMLRRIEQVRHTNKLRLERIAVTRSRIRAVRENNYRHLEELEEYQRNRENARDWTHPRGFANLLLNALLVWIIGRKLL